MDLEIVRLNAVSQTKKGKYDIAYMWNLKKWRGTNELIYKTEVESQMYKYGYQGMWGGVINWKTEIDIYTLLYIK